MGSNFAARIRAEQDRMFNAGFDTGEQFSADCFARAMYRYGISKRQIVEITSAAMEEANEYGDVFEIKHNAEADYKQDKFDRGLREIFGDLFKPFRQRYDWIKEIKY